jgi:TonB-linked SusC/RagA family outer membrane protein
MRKLLLFLLLSVVTTAQLLAQNRTINGTVTDEKGRGLANATVTVKGTKIATSTALDGSFSLNVPANATTLIVSSVGFDQTEISISGKSNINAQLSTKSGKLDEVVVVAYGSQKRADITGSVASVKSQDIENKPFTSIDKTLQGQVAGLQSVAASGAPGSNQNIRIRGISSITAGNAPLWVIDGVPANTGDASRLSTTGNLLSTLNPNDIESVSVLKDAAAQSIYGSRAANGVILVTTKSGKAGKTKFKFDAEIGQSDRAFTNDRYRILHAAEFFDLTRKGLLAGGFATPATVDAVMASSFGFSNGNDFDWLGATTQKGTQQQYDLSASGGNEKTTFYLSGGYFNQEGTVIKSALQRYSTAIRLMNKATDRLTFNFNLNIGSTKQNTPSAGGAFANPVLDAYFLLPSKTAYLPDGSLNYNSPDFPLGAVNTFNPVALAVLNKDQLSENAARGNLSAEYNIWRSLNFKTTFGTDYNLLEENIYWNPLYGDGYSTDPADAGRAYSYDTRYFNYVSTNLLSYRQNITKSDDVYVDLQLGYEAQKSKQRNVNVQARGFPTRLELTQASSGSKPQTAGGTISEYSFLSQFSSATVNYKDRYILSGSFRRDGSSRFAPSHRFGNFWSVGVSWNLDRESFMESVDFISQLKLRSSYGTNGNAGIGNYDWYASYSFASPYNNAPGSAPGAVGNPELTWELNKPFNVGIDLGILKNRISLTADYYKRTSENLLLNVTLSRTSGFTTATQNIGAMENKGVELTLNAVPVQLKDFSWNVNFNFAHNVNKVTSLPEGKDFPSLPFMRRPGYDVQSFFLKEYAGANPANGEPLWFVDRSTKGNLLTNDVSVAQRAIIGSASPKYFGGLTNSISYKGFELEALFYYNFGNLLQDTWSGYVVGSGNGASWNKVARQLEAWQKPYDQTMIARYIYNGNRNFHDNGSAYWLNKGDFIRLRNIQVGYNLSKNLISRVKLSNAFFYVRGTNLWTWVKDKNLGFDPEQGITSQTNLDVYVPKTLTAGINIGF